MYSDTCVQMYVCVYVSVCVRVCVMRLLQPVSPLFPLFAVWMSSMSKNDHVSHGVVILSCVCLRVHTHMPYVYSWIINYLRPTPLLEQCYSEFGPWSGNVDIIGELVRDADSGSKPETAD